MTGFGNYKTDAMLETSNNPKLCIVLRRQNAHFNKLRFCICRKP
jgi:hypothetical protein